MEEDIINLNPAQLDKTFEEIGKEDNTVLVHFNDEDAWTFNIWMEFTQHLKDVQKETNDKAQPFLWKT
jgi:hypothetical protein